MFAKIALVVGFFSASISYAALPPYMNIGMACDENYAKPTAEAIATVKASNPDTLFNIMVFGKEISPDSVGKLESMSNPQVKVFVFDIDTLPIDREEMERFSVKWPNLIFLKLQFPGIFAHLNTQADFTKRLLGCDRVSSVLWLDSDLWVFDDFCKVPKFSTNHSIVLSADLNQMTDGRLVGLRMGKSVHSYTSAGVMYFDLQAFLERGFSSDLFLQEARLELREYQRNVSLDTTNLAKCFLSAEEDISAKMACLKHFVSAVKKCPCEGQPDHLAGKVLTQESFDNILSETASHFQACPQFAQCFVDWNKEFMDVAMNVAAVRNTPGLLFKRSILVGTRWLLKDQDGVTKASLLTEDDRERAMNHAGLDEAALDKFITFPSLPVRCNFNPKNFLFSLSPADDYHWRLLEVRDFSDMAQQILRLSPGFAAELIEELKNLIVLHYDGAIKPWSAEFAELARTDPDVRLLFEFYRDKIQQSTPFREPSLPPHELIKDELDQFKNRLVQIATERFAPYLQHADEAPSAD
ncbi:MAG: hypothetical protein LBL30_01885 [Holosporales bacterium]|jgi:lipopolysaccharide biosynthesis glycosyltransferase|nr:hypothetical protein [Holosporales bacterium]